MNEAHAATPRAERLDPGQVALLFDALVGQGGTGVAVDRETAAKKDAELDREIARAEQAQAAAEPSTPPQRKARKTGPGWQTLASSGTCTMSRCRPRHARATRASGR